MVLSATNRQTIDYVVQKRAAIYIRVSNKTQEKGYSLKTQLDGCLVFCQERGYSVSERHIFRETKTGVIYRERDVLNAARKAARNGEFDVLVVYDVDRFSRDPIHQLIISDELAQHKVKLESVLREIDDSDEGQIIQFHRGYAGKLEYERLLDRTARGLTARIDNGHLRACGRALYGYEWKDTIKKKSAYVYSSKVVWVDTDGTEWTERDVVAFIFALAKQGYTLRSIAGILNGKGIPTPNNTGKKLWQAEKISRIVNNKAYAGIAEVLKKEYTKEPDGTKHAKVRPESERKRLPDGVIPAIVDLATFEAIQVQLKQHKDTATRNNQHTSESLLRYGLVFCGHCGLRMHAKYQKNAYPGVYYQCPSQGAKYGGCKELPGIKASFLDEAVWKYVCVKINDPTQVEEFVVAQLKSEEPLLQEAESIQHSIDKITQQQNNLLESLQHIDPSYAQPTYDKLNTLAGTKRELEENLSSVDRLLKTREEIDQELREFQEWCANFRKEVDQENATYEDKRRACERFNIKVYVYKKDKHIQQPIYEITAQPVIVLHSACSRQRERPRQTGCRC
jgi:site-specific DNA recombinase